MKTYATLGVILLKLRRGPSGMTKHIKRLIQRATHLYLNMPRLPMTARRGKNLMSPVMLTGMIACLPPNQRGMNHQSQSRIQTQWNLSIRRPHIVGKNQRCLPNLFLISLRLSHKREVSRK